MIEKMSKVSLFIIDKYKDKALLELNKFGSVHVKYSDSVSNEANDLKQELNKIHKIKNFLVDIKIKESNYINSMNGVKHEVEKIANFIALYEQNIISINNLKKEFEGISKWGNFKPYDLNYLTNKSIFIQLYKLSDKQFEAIQFEKNFKIFKVGFDKQSKKNLVALVSFNKQNFNNIKIEPIILNNSKSLDDLSNEIDQLKKSNNEIYQKIIDSKKLEKVIIEYEKKIVKKQEFINIKDTMNVEKDSICLINGYIPCNKEVNLRLTAKKFGWGLALSSPNREDKHVPVKLKYNLISKLIKPVTDFLEIIPNYWEPDVSFSFFMFFAIFFAMIVGDAAYGIFFIVFGIFKHMYVKRLKTDIAMFYVLGLMTVIWGTLSGSWFGSKVLAETPLLKSLTYWRLSNFTADLFADDLGLTKKVIAKIQQNAIMTVCFVLAVLHLSVARIWSFIRKLPSLNAFSELAMLSMLVGFFFIVMFMVGIMSFYNISIYLISFGVIGLILFKEQEKGKSFFKGLLNGVGGIKLLNIFLDSVGAFSDIMSYIRLFAVGMASFSIASSFNGMAYDLINLGGIFYFFGALIFIIGHTINFLLACLSVIVHAVRLNILEFSNNLGIEWSGTTAYKPFGGK